MDVQISEALTALDKLDHTLCLNQCKGNIEYGIDTDFHVDCTDINEMISCIELVRTALEEAKKEIFYLQEDIEFYNEQLDYAVEHFGVDEYTLDEQDWSGK